MLLKFRQPGHLVALSFSFFSFSISLHLAPALSISLHLSICFSLSLFSLSLFFSSSSPLCLCLSASLSLSLFHSFSLFFLLSLSLSSLSLTKGSPASFLWCHVWALVSRHVLPSAEYPPALFICPPSCCGGSEDEKPSTVVTYAQRLHRFGIEEQKMEQKISAMRALQSQRAGVGVPSGSQGGFQWLSWHP